MSSEGTMMNKDEFNKFFQMALTDDDFRNELEMDGFGCLERHGFDVKRIPPEIRSSLSRMPGRAVTANRCGTCGICGLCNLCGEINAGSGAAFLWATFFLGGGSITAANQTKNC